MQMIEATRVAEMTEAIAAQARSVDRTARLYIEAEEPDEIDRVYADLAGGIMQLRELQDQLEDLAIRKDPVDVRLPVGTLTEHIASGAPAERTPQTDLPPPGTNPPTPDPDPDPIDEPDTPKLRIEEPADA